MGELFGKDEIYVGRDMGGHEYEISPKLIETFTAGTGDNNPWYTENTPLGGPIAPALILHSECYSTLAWYLPNIYGNLHAKQEWEIFAPVMAGEKLRSRMVIVDRYFKRDREYVVNEVLIFNESGRVVSRSRTYQSFLAHNRGEGMVIDKSREKQAGRTFKIGEGQGQRIESPTRQITEEMCMAFSGPARNYHNDRQKAKELGFPDIVVQGMLSVCLVAEMMTRQFGLGFLSGGKLNLNLVNVVWGSDSVAAKGVIVERKPEGKRTRAEVEVWCEKQDGTKVIVGSASALEL